MAYYFFALALVGGGIWLVLFILALGGHDPFSLQVAPATLKDRLSAAFSPSVSYWSVEILAWSEAWDLDPLLVATVMQIESCGNPNVVSPAGAQGLFQVMPFHFNPGENTRDPETNALRGLAYLSQSITLSGGDLRLTLAGYNGGHGQITRDATLWPEETRRYADWGTSIYLDASGSEKSSNALTAWMEAGGWHLCHEAEQVLGLK